jgi:glycerate 2-kinase
MNILIATDKFKHSLTSFEVCDAIEKGLLMNKPDFKITKLPLSDGGDGLAEVIAYYLSLIKRTITVNDPLMRPVQASYYVSQDGKKAFIEMAQASGLHLLQPSEFNCMLTNSYGTGELIKAAIGSGAEEIILGIGGSATHDCATGMAEALGYRFFDGGGNEIQPSGGNLSRIASIDTSVKEKYQGIKVKIACDVVNLLTGESGAARVYAPQKGASPEMVDELEKGTIHFSGIVKRDMGLDLTNIKGGGAAGGMGAGCVAFLNAELVSGTELLFEYSKAEEKIIDADIVITGEGKIDIQTLEGKLIWGVANLCRKHAKPAVAICGASEISVEQIKKLGLIAAFSIINKPMTVEEAFANAFELVTQAAFNVAGILALR